MNDVKGDKAQSQETMSQILGAMAERIRVWRRRHGLTQAELAHAAGVSVSFISMIERGERSPSCETLFQLAQALEISLSEMFRSTTDSTPEEGYFRRLSDYARDAQLSRKQVDQLVRVGRALFGNSGSFEEPSVLPRSGPISLADRVAKNCSVTGCSRPTLARGLCASHYRREMRLRLS